MLQKFREQIKGWIATVVIGILVVPFALWGVSSYSQYTQGDWVAKVDGETISVSEFRNEWQQQLARFQQMLGAQYRPDMFDTPAARGQMVDQMVRRALIESRTRDARYRVGDAALAAEIQQLEFFQVEGKFSPEVYAQKLGSINLTRSQFEARLRRDILLAQLPDAVAGSEFVTDAELARAFALRDEQRAATWIPVPAVKFLPEIELGEAELTAWYEANKARYMTEEHVTLEYLELTPAALPADAAPTDDQLRELYDAEQERFARAEQRQARHILLDASDPAKAEALAQQLLARLRQGEDFAKLATQFSQDPGSANVGGDLGWFERGAMTGAFEDAVFAMKQGELRGPIKTEFGLHIVRLEGVRGAESRPFDEVRGELAEQWSADRAADRFAKAAEQLADLTYANPDALQPAAEAIGLKVGRVEDVSRAGGADVAVEQRVRDAAFSVDVLGERKNSAPIEIAPDHLVVVRVADHFPAQQRAYAEVAAQVLDAARDERAGLLAQARADEVAAKLRAGAIPEAVARDAGLPAPTTRVVRRSDDQVQAEIVRALFGIGTPVAGQALAGVAVLPSGDRLVFRIDAVIPGDLAALPEAERAARRDEIARRAGTIALTAYTAALERAAEVVYQKDKAQ